MRSGIGDPKNVCKAGVPLMINQEHVGKHLKDQQISGLNLIVLGSIRLTKKHVG